MQADYAAEVAGPDLAVGTEFGVCVAAAVGVRGVVGVGVVEAGVCGGGGGGAGVADGVVAVAFEVGRIALATTEDVGVDAERDASGATGGAAGAACDGDAGCAVFRV